MEFQVELAQFSGPIDLLLHIVRREEIDLATLPLARVIDQYLQYLEVLVELQVDDVGDFLEMASMLIEWKSKQAIPSESRENHSEAGGEPWNEHSEDLVQRLLEYRRFRDAANLLEDQSRRWQLRFARLANDLPTTPLGSDLQPIEPVEVWDLVSAFGRILRERKPPQSAEVIYDDTPIQSHMAHIHRLVVENSRVELTSLFHPKMHKSALIGMFMATLELTRHHGVVTEQAGSGHPLFLVAGQHFQTSLDLSHSVQGDEEDPQEKEEKS
jgi:segregation and condensation protein A